MKIISPLDRLAKSLGDLMPDALLAVSARVAIFIVFWSSVQNRLNGGTVLGQKWQFWNISGTTRLLYEHDYALPLIPSALAAYILTITQFFLSLFILVGLLTRISAFGLLLITLIIQVYMAPAAWQAHLLWAVVLVYLLKSGAGRLSVDSLSGNQ